MTEHRPERWVDRFRSSDLRDLNEFLESAAESFHHEGVEEGGWPDGELDDMAPFEVRRIVVEGVSFDIRWLPDELSTPWLCRNAGAKRVRPRASTVRRRHRRGAE